MTTEDRTTDAYVALAQALWEIEQHGQWCAQKGQVERAHGVRDALDTLRARGFRDAYVACGSKVAWPTGQCRSCEVDTWENVACDLPLGHPDPRDHTGSLGGFARGQQQVIEVRVSWTRPLDSGRERARG
jgi:hypothetical protein